MVGAGPAGSTAAFYLADDPALDVLIVDRQTFPRPKPCGGALVCCRDWNKEFRNYEAAGPIPNGHAVSSVRLCLDRRTWWEGQGEHFFDHVQRDDFDDRLLRVALARPGVSFRTFHVRSVLREDDGTFMLSDGKEALHARAVVGADGVTSRLARVLGNPPRTLTNAGVCRVHHLECDRDHETAHVFYLLDGSPGYGYLFPTAAGYCLGVGFLGDAGRRAKKHLAALLEHCLAAGLVPTDHHMRRTSGALAPASAVRHIADDGILLTGDAAGLLHQLSGEGIYYAMHSGRLAGAALAEGLGGAAERYRAAVQPLIDEVTYLRTLRPRLLGAGLAATFRVADVAVGLGLDSPIRGALVNRLFRRPGRIEGSVYGKLDGRTPRPS